MHFIPPSREVLEHLEVTTPVLGADLQARARRIADRVPSCVAVSAVLGPTALTLALLADPDAAIPPPAPMRTEPTSDDALDELAWQKQRAEDPDARCAASLALPFPTSVGGTGHLTIYAADPRAFDDVDLVRAAAGLPDEIPVANHDLPMRSLDDARAGLGALAALDTVELAVGFLVGALEVAPDEARQILRLGAARRGVDLATHARTVLHPFDR
ncbi:hypothetical protein AB6N24_14355 [Cellulomonas sp. 179-A 4D5 NHS]|uniref:hypothetical protein n=1 Tax=Cellulomonas sp. 179-A 4D5 NHS TaxID=3142378 RepID=UPI0039A283CC